MLQRQLIAAFCVLLMQPAAAGERPADGFELLDSMSRAMQTQAYSGTFVYRHKDKVETLKILHRNRDGRIDERLITLSGKPREIIRVDSVVTCIWPDSKLLRVDRGRAGSNFPGLVFQDLKRVVQNYDVRVNEQTERIAGRDCLIVDVQPKDRLRYGYRLWIDRNNHLLVRSDLLSEAQRPLEQVIFTELTIHESLPDSAFEPELLTEGFKRQETDESAQSVDMADAGKEWRISPLPPGFVLQLHKQRMRKKGNVRIEHMVFSDGLASVSVFIEPAADDKSLKADHRRRGALNVHNKLIAGRKATIVGEVPEQTVELIAESLQYEGEK